MKYSKKQKATACFREAVHHQTQCSDTTFLYMTDWTNWTG